LANLLFARIGEELLCVVLGVRARAIPDVPQCYNQLEGVCVIMKVKSSWLVATLLLLSIVTVIGSASTSGYVSPQNSFTFLPTFHSLTFLPTLTFTFPTVTSESTEMFTFLPTFTFTFPTITSSETSSVTSSMTTSSLTLPPATSTILKQTDWAVLGVNAQPLNPQAGVPMVFSMTFAALSSNAPFPQTVYVECQIDGFSCGAGPVSYGGPIGTQAVVTADNYWPATPGLHILTWYVNTANDPNTSNNVLSVQFYVQPPPPPPTTMTPSTQTTQVPVTPSNQTPSTIIQTSILTVTPSTSSTELTAGLLQGYTLPLVVIILILIVGLALATRKRTQPTQPTGPQPNSWYCTHCGTPNGSNDNFCKKCGTAKPKL